MITVPYAGGKCKIYNDLRNHIPILGTKYIEPFAGRGNVILNLLLDTDYDEYIINDKYTGDWFKVLIDFDPILIPDEVNPLDMQHAYTPLARVLEPWVSFRGKGYTQGVGFDHYDPQRIRNVIKRLQEHRTKIKISSKDYLDLDYSDAYFVYFDPPYFETNIKTYSNINHDSLIDLVLSLDCFWMLSGYPSDLYYQRLGEPTQIIERNQEMSNCSITVEECLWMG